MAKNIEDLVKNKAKITAGYIINNELIDHDDNGIFGGGGIYVNGMPEGRQFKYKGQYYYGLRGELELYNTIITDNTTAEARYGSGYDGAGYAACPISVTEINVTDGVAIYNNIIENDEKEKSDIHILSGRNYDLHSGWAVYKLSKRMLGGVPNEWRDQKGELLPENKYEGTLPISGTKRKLKLHTDNEGNDLTNKLAKVFITGNHSASRGGGIGSNGSVIFGKNEKVDIKVKKSWEPQDEKPPVDKITIDLVVTLDGKDYVIETRDITADDNWETVFKDLPSSINGDYNIYSVREHEDEEIDGYISKINKKSEPEYELITFEITNVKNETEINVSKDWDDSNNQDGLRPESIIVKLYKTVADGEKELVSTKEIRPNEERDWTYSFTNLPKYTKDNELIEYTLEEEKVSNYDTEITGDAETGFTITNTHEPRKIEINVSKIWDDNDNQDGMRPESITVILFADGKDTGKSIILSDENNWTAKFKDLPDFKDGNKINYILKEVDISGYTITITNSEESDFTITNTHKPSEIEMAVSKVWDDYNDQDGIRPESVIVRLLADGEDTGRFIKLSDDNNWSTRFANLPEYKEGKKIEYTLEEVEVPGYEISITGDAESDFTIKNTHKPSEIEINVSKFWDDYNDQDGIRPESVMVRLLADGENTDRFIKLSDENNWSARFANLPEFKDGKKINYTLKEVDVSGYTTTITGDPETDFTITNTHKPSEIEITVSKVWDDYNDQDGLRPESVIVKLLADGEDTGRFIKLSDDNNWSTRFANLPEYKDGKKIEYSLEEVEVAGYEISITGDAESDFTITNIHKPSEIEITVSKVWVDYNDQDGLRPESVIVKLLADGEDTGRFIKLSDENNWSTRFANLPEYKEGKKIEYTLEEVEVPGYEISISGESESDFTITNTHKPSEIEIDISKVWDDANDQDGIRPESVIVRLLADGEDTGRFIKLSDENNWSTRFANLPEFKDGEKIEYSLEEVEVPGYEISITAGAESDFTITNTHKPSETEVRVSKIWDDADNQDGLRPETICIKLLADGEDTGKTVDLSADNDWTAVFTNLAEFKDGEKIEYTIAEVDTLDGYVCKVEKINENEYTVTNTHEPSKTEVKVSKVWEDEDNKDDLRPDTVTIKLLADDEDTGVSLDLSADNEWTATFTNLPEYKEGKKIDYTVKEIDVAEGYKVKVEKVSENEYKVINTHEPTVPGEPTTKTGESLGAYSLIGLLMLGLGIVLAIIKKKFRKNPDQD